jgi:hypothetical protein
VRYGISSVGGDVGSARAAERSRQQDPDQQPAHHDPDDLAALVRCREGRRERDDDLGECRQAGTDRETEREQREAGCAGASRGDDRRVQQKMERSIPIW